MSEIAELKQMLSSFIQEQKAFNGEVSGFIQEQKVFNGEVSGFMQEQKAFNEEVSGFMQEQKAFNEEQRAFNVGIDKKVDRVQYFLEETVASYAKMYFEEQIGIKRGMREMEEEIADLKNQLLDLSSRVNLLFKV